MNLTELKKKRESQINSIFILMLEIIVIFAVPAFLAVVIGKRLDLAEGKFYTYLLLAIAFITSWAITIFIYKKKTKELAETEVLIKKQNV